MSEVFLYQPLGDAQSTGELMAGHWSAGQEFHDALPRGLFGRRHGEYGRHSCQEKPERSTLILGKSSEVVGA